MLIKLGSRNRYFHCQFNIFVSSLRDARDLQEYVHRRDANDFTRVPTMLFTALIDVTVVLNEVDVLDHTNWARLTVFGQASSNQDAASVSLSLSPSPLSVLVNNP